MNKFQIKECNILLAEDNPGDIILIMEAFADSELNFNITTINNGGDVLDYLLEDNLVLPDILILDLNLPRINGKEILRKIKNNSKLDVIPVIVFTSSEAESDIIECYKLKANCYITKPVDYERFIEVIRTIEKFWISVVTLPHGRFYRSPN